MNKTVKLYCETALALQFFNILIYILSIDIPVM